MGPGLVGLDLKELTELTFKLAYHTKGGIDAGYIDTLPPREALHYFEHLAAQRDREQREIDKLTRGT